jgi:hypothetical protein
VPASTVNPGKKTIPPVSWWKMRHPQRPGHLLSHGWTIAEIASTIREIDFSGDVSVVGSQELATKLARRARAVDSNNLIFNSVVIVESKHASDAARDLQQRAKEQSVALIVWKHPESDPPPSELIEVLTKSASPEQETWLGDFLDALYLEVDPEEAFRRASADRSLADQQSRWLRGAANGWRVSNPSPGARPPPDWKTRLDRMRQEVMLRHLAELLIGPGRRRRVQVVVTPGDEGAALKYFADRELRIDGAAVRHKPVAWAEQPSAQIRAIARYDGQNPDGLASFFRRLPAEKGEPTLHWYSHEPASLSGDVPPKITVDELETYFRDLRKLAERIDDAKARVLVHVPLYRQPHEQDAALRALKGLTNEAFKVDILPSIGAAVPEEEVVFFLESHGIVVDDPLREELQTRRDYSELIKYLERTMGG